MDSRKKKEILDALGQYVPIKRDLGSLSVTKAPQYLATLLKDDQELAAFFMEPRQALKKAGIDPVELDIPLFIELLKYLKDRQVDLTRPSPEFDPTHLGATDRTKEKEKAQQWDFKHAKEWYVKVEPDWWRTRGRDREKEQGEIIERDKGFKEKGVGLNPVVLLRAELRSLFFPAQPLVTPELLEKIKQLLETA